MSKLRAELTAEIPAPPDRVYAVFADYRSAHAQVLPSFAFAGLDVESGGYGAGTVFRTTLREFGSLCTMRMAVTEPEPGRVLMESDLDSDLVTTFTVRPTGDPQRSRVTIATGWSAKGGIAGLLDRLVMSPLMRMVFRKELQLVERYLAQSRVETTRSRG